MKLKIAILILILLPVLTVASLYTVGLNTSFGLRLASALNLPLAEVNGERVPIKVYLDDLKAAKASTELEGLTDEEKKKVALDKVIEEYVVKSLLPENFEIEPQELENLTNDLLTNFGITEVSDQELKEAFGYDQKSFSARVAVPFYMKQQLRKNYILTSDNQSRLEAQILRQNLETDPQLFDSYETTQLVIPADQLVDTYAHIASLEVGDFSNTIANPDGYRIYRVENIVDEEGSVVYELSEVFLPVQGFEGMLQQRVSDADIRYYVKNIL